MLNYNYAIELGSSFTTIYKTGLGVILKEPSIIAVENIKGKNSVKCVGYSAKKLIGKTNNSVEIIEPIKDGVIINKEYAKLLLKTFLKMVEFKSLFTSNNVIMLTPSSITAHEKNEYANISYAVGFSYVQILPNIIAGMIGLDVDYNDSRSHMIVNLGGGVIDIAVINHGEIINACSIDMGGRVLDYAIYKYILDTYNLTTRINSCEEVKCELSTLLPNDYICYTMGGINTTTNQHQEIVLTSQELRPLFMDFYNRVGDGITGLLNSCSPEIVSDIKKYGIYVCGGLSRTTGVDVYLKNKLDIPVYVAPDPENVIIMGAGNLLNNPSTLNELIGRLE